MNPLSKKIDSPKIALVYDWLTTAHGGAEQVINLLHTAFPKAPIFTTIHNPRQTPWTATMHIKTSWLQHVPFSRRFHHILSPLMPMAIEALELDEFDIVISITSSVAKGVITKPHQLHLCYLLTPTRYIHHPESSIGNEFSWMKLGVFSKAFSGIFSYLKRWDAVAANRPDAILPISNLVAQRVKQVYDLDSMPPLYPAIHLATPKKTLKLPNDTVLSMSRLVSYKHIDAGIEACISLGWNMIIAGEGRAFHQLVKIASDHAIVREKEENLEKFISRALKSKKSILFTNNCTDTERLQLLDAAEFAVTPGLEDYGISSLEAVSAGCKLVTNAKSGSSELLDTLPGVKLLDNPNAENIVLALKKLKTQPKPTIPTKLKKTLNVDSFLKDFSRIVYDTWQLHQKV